MVCLGEGWSRGSRRGVEKGKDLGLLPEARVLMYRDIGPDDPGGAAIDHTKGGGG